MLNEIFGTVVIVNALAPALKAMPLTWVAAETETFGTLEKANAAISVGALGTVLGIQFVAVFQSPEVGFVFQVALPAKALFGCVPRSTKISAPRMVLRPLLSLTGCCVANDGSR
ncbi:MAG: hypothetical protein H0T11_01600 [Chthoniobacterales bacterium]|nr:hypothetical protein [Chthoniobacterales bacterium]